MLRVYIRAACLAATLVIAVVPAGMSARAAAPIRIGAVFPLRSIGALARQEYRGVQIAAQLVNAEGGVDGRRIQLVTRELDTPAESGIVMRLFRQQGIKLVIGAYSSDLSIPTAAAAARQGLVYWEAGAVADRLT